MPYLAKEPEEKAGYLVLVLKENVVADFDKYRELRVLSLKVGAVATTNPPGFKILLSEPEPIAQPETVKQKESSNDLDVEALCIQELKRYFQPDTERELAAQCVSYLAGHGWNEAMFQTEIGISKATVWRYLKAAKDGSTVSD